MCSFFCVCVCVLLFVCLFLTRFYLGLCTSVLGRKTITIGVQGMLHKAVSGPEDGSCLVLFTGKKKQNQPTKKLSNHQLYMRNRRV